MQHRIPKTPKCPAMPTPFSPIIEPPKLGINRAAGCKGLTGFASTKITLRAVGPQSTLDSRPNQIPYRTPRRDSIEFPWNQLVLRRLPRSIINQPQFSQPILNQSPWMSRRQRATAVRSNEKHATWESGKVAWVYPFSPRNTMKIARAGRCFDKADKTQATGLHPLHQWRSTIRLRPSQTPGSPVWSRFQRPALLAMCPGVPGLRCQTLLVYSMGLSKEKMVYKHPLFNDSWKNYKPI